MTKLTQSDTDIIPALNLEASWMIERACSQVTTLYDILHSALL